MFLSRVFYSPENVTPQNNYVTENEEGQLTNHLFQLLCYERKLATETKTFSNEIN